MRIVLVEPKYAMNVGKICRVMENFGFSELFIVRPKCRLGLTAEKYAKHAVGVLKGARIAGSLKEAVKGCHPVVGTTASLEKGRKGLSKPLPLGKAAPAILNGKMPALVFGGEESGLALDDLLSCTMCTYIETSEKYPSLNLANAAAVVLYTLRDRKRQRERGIACPDPKVIGMAEHYFSMMAYSVKGLRNPGKCRKAFSNMLARSGAERDELHAIICVLRGMAENKSSRPGGPAEPYATCRSRRHGK